MTAALFIILVALLGAGNEQAPRAHGPLRPDQPVRGWTILSDREPDALAVIDAARGYGINHLQLSHQIIEDLRQIRESKRQALVHRLIDAAHRTGIQEVVLWDHALYDLDYYWKDVVNHLAPPWAKTRQGAPQLDEVPWVVERGWLQPGEQMDETYLHYVAREKAYGVRLAEASVRSIRDRQAAADRRGLLRGDHPCRMADRHARHPESLRWHDVPARAPTRSMTLGRRHGSGRRRAARHQGRRTRSGGSATGVETEPRSSKFEV